MLIQHIFILFEYHCTSTPHIQNKILAFDIYLLIYKVYETNRLPCADPILTQPISIKSLYWYTR